MTIVSRCPFPIPEVHAAPIAPRDNGPEFMNAHLYRFFGQLLSGVQWSRSRPYHKNDNRMVEQKNRTLVRAYLGHLPLRSRQQREMLSDPYGDMWLYHNFFQPYSARSLRQRSSPQPASPIRNASMIRPGPLYNAYWKLSCAKILTHLCAKEFIRPRHAGLVDLTLARSPSQVYHDRA